MWSNLTHTGGINLTAYVNDASAPMHHIHVKSGDRMYFKLEGHMEVPATIKVEYNGQPYDLLVIPIKTDKYVEPIASERLPNAEIPKMESEIPQGEIMGTESGVTNIFKTAPAEGYAGGYGGDAGLAAMIPLLALTGALGGRRDGVVGGDVCDASKVAVMTAGFDGINHNINTTLQGLANQMNSVNTGLTNQLNTGFGGQRDLDVMQKLGNIEGDIWKAEGQVQLAVAGAQADINNRVADSLQTTISGQSAIRKDVSDAIAASLASQAIIRHDIATSAGAGIATTLNAKYELSQNIRDDGDKTRALIVRQYEDTLNRQLAVAQDALIEQRAVGRSREVEVNVTQQVTQNQAQLQAQAQQQQQFQVTSNLLQAILSQAQIAQATNQSLIIGNTGAVVGGAQNANPTNVRA